MRRSDAARWLGGWRAVLLLMGLAALVRMGHLWFMADSPVFLVPTSDAHEHHALAVRLAGGDWLGLTHGPYHRPQLFPYIGALVYTAAGVRFPAIHVVSLIAEVLAIGAWYGIARRAFPKVPAFLGGVFLALHWPFVHFTVTGYMETMAMALNGAFLLVLVEQGRRVLRRPGWHAGWLVAAGLLAGLSMMMRPTVLITLPGFAVALAVLQGLRGGGWSRRVGVPVVFLAAALVPVGLNLTRHVVYFGLWAPLGTGSELNFHMGNRIDGWGWDVSSPGIEFTVYQNLPFVDGLEETDRTSIRGWWGERNAAWLAENPGAFLLGLLHKGLILVNAEEVHCTQNFAYARDRSPVLGLLPGLTVLGPFALAGVMMGGWLVIGGLTGRRRPARLTSTQFWAVAVLGLWIVPYFLGVMLYLAIARHRLPIVPPALLLGGWAAWALVASVRGRYPWFGGWVGCLLAALVLSQLPVVPAHYREHEAWWTRINLGVAHRGLGDGDGSVAAFEEATAILPRKMEGWRQLAVTKGAAGDFGGAIEAQRRLLQLQREQYPDHYMVEAEIFEDLAEFELAAGRMVDAEKTARKLVRLVPFAPQGHLLLARALADKDREGARAAAREALGVAPGWPPALALLEELEARGPDSASTAEGTSTEQPSP